MAKVSEEITAKHFNVIIWLVGGLGSALITVVLFVYFSQINYLNERDKEQTKQSEKFYNELLLITSTNTVTLEILKEYLEQQNGINFDKDINERYKLKHSNKRGAICVPNYMYLLANKEPPQ
jgi:hypothetical protein